MAGVNAVNPAAIDCCLTTKMTKHSTFAQALHAKVSGAEPSADFAAELAELRAEAIGWQPLDNGAYLHCVDPQALVIEVVGVADASMERMDVLWLIG